MKSWKEAALRGLVKASKQKDQKQWLQQGFKEGTGKAESHKEQRRVSLHTSTIRQKHNTQWMHLSGMASTAFNIGAFHSRYEFAALQD